MFIDMLENMLQVLAMCEKALKSRSRGPKEAKESILDIDKDEAIKDEEATIV